MTHSGVEEEARAAELGFALRGFVEEGSKGRGEWSLPGGLPGSIAGRLTAAAASAAAAAAAARCEALLGFLASTLSPLGWVIEEEDASSSSLLEAMASVVRSTS